MIPIANEKWRMHRSNLRHLLFQCYQPVELELSTTLICGTISVHRPRSQFGCVKKGRGSGRGESGNGDRGAGAGRGGLGGDVMIGAGPIGAGAILALASRGTDLRSRISMRRRCGMSPGVPSMASVSSVFTSCAPDKGISL